MTLDDIERESREIKLDGGPYQMKHYRENMREVNEKYKIQSLLANELSDHPKADAIWEFAWEEGHSYGLHEVNQWVGKLAELIR